MSGVKAKIPEKPVGVGHLESSKRARLRAARAERRKVARAADDGAGTVSDEEKLGKKLAAYVVAALKKGKPSA